jgi:hypothetical protein
MLRYAAIVVAILSMSFVCGCSPTVDVTKTSKGFQAPTDANTVDILMTVQRKSSLNSVLSRPVVGVRLILRKCIMPFVPRRHRLAQTL